MLKNRLTAITATAAAALLLGACAQSVQGMKPAMEKHVTKADSCAVMASYNEELTNVLETAYKHNDTMGNAAQVAAAGAFVPGVGLVAAGGALVANGAQVSTTELRIMRDRTTDMLFRRLMEGRCK